TPRALPLLSVSVPLTTTKVLVKVLLAPRMSVTVLPPRPALLIAKLPLASDEVIGTFQVTTGAVPALLPVVLPTPTLKLIGPADVLVQLTAPPAAVAKFRVPFWKVRP